MKKRLILLALNLLLTPGLNSCSSGNDTKSDLLITEIIEGSGSNRAIELYNKSDRTISLDDYALGFYVGGNHNVSFSVNLEGEIQPHSIFVAVHTDADEELVSIANLINSNIMFSGAEQISLLKNNKVVDLVGELGYRSSFNEDITLVRKTNYFISRKTWIEYDWIRYSVDNFKYIGNVTNSVTPEEMEQGPRINVEYNSLPFINQEDQSRGGGGFTNVTLYEGVDGDTAKFDYPEIPSINHGTKVRFLNINTPESYAQNIMAWGIPAKFWTTDRLEEATNIKLQSIKDGLLKDTYERILSWVWIDNELLNYKIVKNGFSEISFESDDAQFYKDISYGNWLYDAQLYAKMHKKAIWGEKDPYWDYKTNTSTYEEKFEI